MDITHYRLFPQPVNGRVVCRDGKVAHYHPGDNGQMIHFMKNICMAGGFLQVVAFGAGRLSVDRR